MGNFSSRSDEIVYAPKKSLVFGKGKEESFLLGKKKKEKRQGISGLGLVKNKFENIS